jgi:hypothetical protein
MIGQHMRDGCKSLPATCNNGHVQFPIFVAQESEEQKHHEEVAHHHRAALVKKSNSRSIKN